jgi:hypothetical protein
MFPQIIQFYGEKYRTNSYNKFLDWIFQNTNELQGWGGEVECYFLTSLFESVSVSLEEK